MVYAFGCIADFERPKYVPGEVKCEQHLLILLLSANDTKGLVIFAVQ